MSFQKYLAKLFRLAAARKTSQSRNIQGQSVTRFYEKDGTSYAYKFTAAPDSEGRISLKVRKEAPTQDGWKLIESGGGEILLQEGFWSGKPKKLTEKKLGRIVDAYMNRVGNRDRRFFIQFAAAVNGEEFSKLGYVSPHDHKAHDIRSRQWDKNIRDRENTFLGGFSDQVNRIMYGSDFGGGAYASLCTTTRIKPPSTRA